METIGNNTAPRLSFGNLTSTVLTSRLASGTSAAVGCTLVPGGWSAVVALFGPGHDILFEAAGTKCLLSGHQLETMRNVRTAGST